MKTSGTILDSINKLVSVVGNTSAFTVNENETLVYAPVYQDPYLSILGGDVRLMVTVYSGGYRLKTSTINFAPAIITGKTPTYVVMKIIGVKKQIEVSSPSTQGWNSNVESVSLSISPVNESNLPMRISDLTVYNGQFSKVPPSITGGYIRDFNLLAPGAVVKLAITDKQGHTTYYLFQLVSRKLSVVWNVRVVTDLGADAFVNWLSGHSSEIMWVPAGKNVYVTAVSSVETGKMLLVYVRGENLIVPFQLAMFSNNQGVCATRGTLKVCVAIEDIEPNTLSGVYVSVS